MTTATLARNFQRKLSTDRDESRPVVLPLSLMWNFLAYLHSSQPTQTPTQMPEKRLSMFSSQEIGSSWVSFLMILHAQQSELFRSKLDLSGLKFLKTMEFNLPIKNVFK